MIVVENQRVCELFETQTYCLHVYPCLYEQWFNSCPPSEISNEKPKATLLATMQAPTTKPRKKVVIAARQVEDMADPMDEVMGNDKEEDPEELATSSEMPRRSG